MTARTRTQGGGGAGVPGEPLHRRHVDAGVQRRVPAGWPGRGGRTRSSRLAPNFLDLPDFARDAFGALAWLRGAPGRELAQRVDVPFGRADLNYVTKLALALERR